MLLYFPGVPVRSRKVGAIPPERAGDHWSSGAFDGASSGVNALGRTVIGPLLSEELRIVITMS